MSLLIYVDAYSGFRANERPRQFVIDEDIYEIEEIEEQWQLPDARFFKVRARAGKHYLLRYDESPNHHQMSVLVRKSPVFIENFDWNIAYNPGLKIKV